MSWQQFRLVIVSGLHSIYQWFLLSCNCQLCISVSCSSFLSPSNCQQSIIVFITTDPVKRCIVPVITGYFVTSSSNWIFCSLQLHMLFPMIEFLSFSLQSTTLTASPKQGVLLSVLADPKCLSLFHHPHGFPISVK